MTDADEPPADPVPPAMADATLADKLHSLRRIEIAIGDMIAADNYEAAEQLQRIAREHARQALEAALACAARPPSVRAPFSVEDIQHAEVRLGVEPGIFTSIFAVNFAQNSVARRKALGELLSEAHDELAKAPADTTPLRETPAWLPAIIRIGSAVLVGAAVGAPLAALAVGEPVVVEVAKAGITVTACVVAAEATNHLLERWLRPATPVDPPAPRQPRNLALPRRHGPAARRGALPSPIEKPTTNPATNPAHDSMDTELATPDVSPPPRPPPVPPPPPPPRPARRSPTSGPVRRPGRR